MNEKEFLELFNRYLKDPVEDDFWALHKEFIKLKDNKDLVKKFAQDKDLVFKLLDFLAEFMFWIPQELLTEDMVEFTLKRGSCGYYIKKLEQTPSRCWIVLNNHIHNLEYIKEPTDEMKMFALNKGYAIEDIKNPTAEMCLKALETNVRAIKYIKNPTEEMCFEAISINAKSIGYINNNILTFEIISQAVDQDLEALMYIPYDIINKKNVKYFCKKTAELLEKVVTEGMEDSYVCDSCGYDRWDNQDRLDDLTSHLLKLNGE
jgi:hypothetical protein